MSRIAILHVDEQHLKWQSVSITYCGSYHLASHQHEDYAKNPSHYQSQLLRQSLVHLIVAVTIVQTVYGLYILRNYRIMNVIWKHGRKKLANNPTRTHLKMIYNIDYMDMVHCPNVRRKMSRIRLSFTTQTLILELQKPDYTGCTGIHGSESASLAKIWLWHAPR